MVSKLSPVPVRFWRSTFGREPVREFLSDLPSDDKRIIGRDIAKVQFSWPIGMPLCKSLGNGLWEIRSSLPSKREARLLFGFLNGELIALHVFIKKSQSTQNSELELARQRWKEVSE